MKKGQNPHENRENSALKMGGWEFMSLSARENRHLHLFILQSKFGMEKPQKPLGFWGFVACIY